MVTESTPNEDFGQNSGFAFPNFDTIYEAIFDASFASGPTRTIMLHLDPILSTSSGLVTHEAFQYNPLLGEAIRSAPIERQPGVTKDPHIMNLTAHVKHGPTAIDDESTPLGRLSANEVQTTTDIDDEQFIRNGGIRLDHILKYLIAVWIEFQDVPDGAT